MTAASPAAGFSRLVPMRPRDPRESGRTASTLELFFDLVFVVAVSVASVELHHALTENHVLEGVVAYGAAFFAIWWAWMNFTWFATSFEVDDWLYRVLTFVQMGGVLTFAAGLGSFYDGDFALAILGYVVMRVAMVAQWTRAGHGSPELRRTAYTYAGGVASVQVLWLVLLVVPESVRPSLFAVLLLAEIAVPVVAERNGTTPWHSHHITERYGLFTLILLGESLLGSSNAIIKALDSEADLAPLVAVAVLTLAVTCSLWWIYFWPPHHEAIGSFGQSLRYGYVHYFVFAAAGALSAGIEVEIDALTDHSELSDMAATFTVSVPIAVFILGIWWIAIRDHADRVVNAVVPSGALLVLLDPLIPVPVTLTAVILAIVVVVLVMRDPVTRSSGQEHAEG